MQVSYASAFITSLLCHDLLCFFLRFLKQVFTTSLVFFLYRWYNCCFPPLYFSHSYWISFVVSREEGGMRGYPSAQKVWFKSGCIFTFRRTVQRWHIHSPGGSISSLKGGLLWRRQEAGSYFSVARCELDTLKFRLGIITRHIAIQPFNSL